MPFVVKKYLSQGISILLLIVASIGMIHYKKLIETTSEATYETLFLIFQLLFFFTLGYMIIAWLYQLMKNYRLLKNEKTAAELSLLKSKVDPHFFFNTLNNLYGLAIAKSDKTPEVILRLSEIMRYTIYEGEKNRTILKNEIAYLEEYIEIQKIRYQKNVSITFEKHIQEETAMVAPLLFIMLVENAFKHGIESLTENAFVRFRLEQDENGILFEVINNFEPKKTKTEKMGLKNLKKRLTLLYPDNHRLTLREEGKVYHAQLKLDI
jgi:LytS/YehU family sensor histidine kinase